MLEINTGFHRRSLQIPFVLLSTHTVIVSVRQIAEHSKVVKKQQQEQRLLYPNNNIQYEQV